MRAGGRRLGFLLLIGALARALAPPAEAARIGWAEARLITVLALDYRFVPNHLVFRRGVAYRLHLVNRGKELHELSAPKFFKTVRLRSPAALDSDRTEIVVKPGQQKDLYFIAKRPGRYDMRCPDHDWAGMTGDITVR
ncbi:MAG TPA: cupredoxin domain-containing protein [Stellaceae bacterium]|jgi:uncharacterized cupredoxin-like copper-binding protein|nr:cupredoxin domain-containing protein [Stellaceae bacterium]